MKMVMQIGIMQGRLNPPFEGRFQTFPAHDWRNEFPRAEEAGLASIEWIYETFHEEDNPVKHDAGIDEILKLSDRHKVMVKSICADYYMQRLLISEGKINQDNVEHLRWLMGRAERLGLWYIVLPFVDASSLRTEVDRAAAIEMIRNIIPYMERHDVELHLETDLQPEVFVDLLSVIDHPKLRANYDIGNSASLGYEQGHELKTLGPWLGSVHVKDRVLGGATVTLGTGNADFITCFRQIKASGYERPFILQASRGRDGEEVAWNRQNREFVEQFLEALDS